MNVHDSEKIAGIFHESGITCAGDINNADMVVVNTCSIRDKAEQKVFSELGRLQSIKKLNPAMKIAVAGCIAQQRGSRLFQRFPHVDYVFGPGNLESFRKWLSSGSCAAGQGMKTTALQAKPDFHTDNVPVKREGRNRAWVAVMYGCDNFCSYCVVPYTRGRERSRPAADILSEVRDLALKGYREITLLGQNVNSYGKNLGANKDFSDLLKAIHEVHGIERVRFVTSHPRDLSLKLTESIRTLRKVCEHVHLPMQSGSDRILSLMNRGYTLNTYRQKIALLRKAVPGIAVTTDIIVGYPGETDEDFRSTLTALSDLKFDGIFAFKYSPRPETKALEHDGKVPEAVKSCRLDKVLKIQEDITLQKNKQLEGRVVEVFVEGISGTDRKRVTGRTATNKIVNFSGGRELGGSFVTVRIIKAMQHSLLGELKAVY